MSRPVLLVKSPCGSTSGYGSRSRDMIYELIKSEKFDVKIIPIRWGVLPLGALNEDTPKNNAIKACILRDFNNIPQADYFLHHSVPNEFEKLGKINIGITAGIETDRVAPVWLEKGNIMEMVIVSSQHSKMVYKNSGYQLLSRDGKNIPIGNLTCIVPLEVIFEGVDTSIYNNAPYDPLAFERPGALKNGMTEISTNFNFLFMGHWLPGGIGEDRKNVGKLIKSFLTAFDYNPDVGLILKTAIGPNSIPDKYKVLDRIKRTVDKIEYKFHDKSPKIYLVHGTLTDYEMAQLYKHPKVNAFITLTHGEGFGRPIIEAAACDVPIIAPAWSGQVDFLNRNYTYLLDTNMVQLPEPAIWDGVLERGSFWSDVDENHVIKAMTEVYHKNDEWKEKGKKLGDEIRSKWTVEQMGEKLMNLILSFKVNQSIINIPQGINFKKIS